MIYSEKLKMRLDLLVISIEALNPYCFQNHQMLKLYQNKSTNLVRKTNDNTKSFFLEIITYIYEIHYCTNHNSINRIAKCILTQKGLSTSFSLKNLYQKKFYYIYYHSYHYYTLSSYYNNDQIQIIALHNLYLISKMHIKSSAYMLIKYLDLI